MHELTENIVFNYSYFQLFGLSFTYFMMLYFGIGPLFLMVCKFLERKKILYKIEKKEVQKKQIIFEMKHSFKSIIVFGFSIIPVIYIIRIETVALLPDSWSNIFIGVIILNIWNEIHFFIVHRMMHLRFFMAHIHHIHHQSRVPTVYSVYSFHWIEALFLSTVPLIIIPFVPFSIVAIFLYPLTSILLNYAGHCNYRFGQGKGDSWMLFGTYHNQHHSKGKKNYGFALNLLDKLFSKRKQEKV